jgi:hypothetical protein
MKRSRLWILSTKKSSASSTGMGYPKSMSAGCWGYRQQQSAAVIHEPGFSCAKLWVRKKTPDRAESRTPRKDAGWPAIELRICGVNTSRLRAFCDTSDVSNRDPSLEHPGQLLRQVLRFRTIGAPVLYRQPMRSRLALVTVTTLVVLLASSCGGDPDAKPAERDTSAKTAKNDEPKLANDDVEKYFEAIVSSDPDQLDDASEIAAPGSIAEAYLKYHRAGIDAQIDGGVQDEGSELKKVEDGYKDCSNPDDPKDCVVWSDFESVDGRLANFTINDKDLKDRISLGNGSKVKAGDLGSVEFLVAYQSVQSSDLFVIVRVASRDATSLNAGSATYRDPDKRQSTASSYYGADELGADSTATLAMIFSRAKPGGEATLTFNSENYARSEDAKFKTR